MSPGRNAENLDLLHYRLTEYGQKVLAAEAAHPYDQVGYMARLNALAPPTDATVAAYMGEALVSFHRGTPVASIIMLGIAAERVFLLVCDSLLSALISSSEKAQFTKLRDGMAMKPKLDWVHEKLLLLQRRSPRLPGFPDDATQTVTAIYNLLRVQRNDLGHPSDTPPPPKRDEAFRSLLIFPGFYGAAEELRRFLAANKV
jgi:hypothetical protein